MPAQIVIALDDVVLADNVADVLMERGYDAAAFPDSMTALEALETAQRADLLIACMDCGDGKPNGVSLARMARLKRPGIKVMFIGAPEMFVHTEGIGDLVTPPLTAIELADRVAAMLRAAEPAREA